MKNKHIYFFRGHIVLLIIAHKNESNGENFYLYLSLLGICFIVVEEETDAISHSVKAYHETSPNSWALPRKSSSEVLIDTN